jgi:hypothetical protein
MLDMTFFFKNAVEVMTLLLKRCQIPNPWTVTAEFLFHLRLLHRTPTLIYYSIAVQMSYHYKVLNDPANSSVCCVNA